MSAAAAEWEFTFRVAETFALGPKLVYERGDLVRPDDPGIRQVLRERPLLLAHGRGRKRGAPAYHSQSGRRRA